MQKHVNLVDLVKSFPTNSFLQKLASIQKRTSPVKFAHLAEKSGKGSISNLSESTLNIPVEKADIGKKKPKKRKEKVAPKFIEEPFYHPGPASNSMFCEVGCR